jgi:sialic acid synthase SpsE/quercetin dioxygenase-like cupin family protein
MTQGTATRRWRWPRDEKPENEMMEDGARYDFDGLVVFDLANNHQGDVDHGCRIIAAMGETARKHGVRAAMKFQFRQLDSFIHKDHLDGSSNKHVSRFLSTRLDRAGVQALFDEVARSGMASMCTPFDEESVDVIQEMGFDILKIASCSAADWPLLEKAASSGLPIVCSTGGLDTSQIDDLYSFFTHRGVDFAFMHCVSIYPTPANMLELNQIDAFRHRYPEVPIGWSTHEDPNALGPVQIAAAKGAQLFERHVGIETDTISLNGYSSRPEQVDAWLGALVEARTMCGGTERPPVSEEERESLLTLERGVYLREDVKAGDPVTEDKVYFAMPIEEGQLSSGRFKPGIVAQQDFEADGALTVDGIELPPPPADHLLKKAVHEVKALLNTAQVHLNTEFKIEFSHHYGIERFLDVGAVLIDIVNREYCKKIIVQLPGQVHPQHFHKRKEETFQVLYGTLNVTVDGRKRVLEPGDTCLVQPGMWHNFWTETGCVFEEISTRHFNDDSFYKDKKINAMERSERKTIVNHWGRYELLDQIDSQ